MWFCLLIVAKNMQKPYPPGSLWARQKWITAWSRHKDWLRPATTVHNSFVVHICLSPLIHYLPCMHWLCWHVQGAKERFVSSRALATSFSKPAFSDSALTWMGKERHGLKPGHPSVVCHLQSQLKIHDLLHNMCTKFSKAQHPTICQGDPRCLFQMRRRLYVGNNHWPTLRPWLYDVWSESCQSSIETLHWLLLQESFPHPHSETVLTCKQHAKPVRDPCQSIRNFGPPRRIGSIAPAAELWCTMVYSKVVSGLTSNFWWLISTHFWWYWGWFTLGFTTLLGLNSAGRRNTGHLGQLFPVTNAAVHISPELLRNCCYAPQFVHCRDSGDDQGLVFLRIPSWLGLQRLTVDVSMCQLLP